MATKTDGTKVVSTHVRIVNQGTSSTYIIDRFTFNSSTRIRPIEFRGLFGSRSRQFERNKNVSSPSTCESQYCGEPP